MQFSFLWKQKLWLVDLFSGLISCAILHLKFFIYFLWLLQNVFCIITKYQFLYGHTEWDIYFRSTANEPFFFLQCSLKRKMRNNWDDLWSTSGAACEAEVALAVAAIEWPLFFLLLLGSCCSVLGMLQNKQLMKTLMLVISFRLLPNRPQIGQRNKRWRMSSLPVSRSCLVLQIKGGMRWNNTLQRAAEVTLNESASDWME